MSARSIRTGYKKFHNDGGNDGGYGEQGGPIYLDGSSSDSHRYALAMTAVGSLIESSRCGAWG